MEKIILDWTPWRRFQWNAICKNGIVISGQSLEEIEENLFKVTNKKIDIKKVASIDRFREDK